MKLKQIFVASMLSVVGASVHAMTVDSITVDASSSWYIKTRATWAPAADGNCYTNPPFNTINLWDSFITDTATGDPHHASAVGHNAGGQCTALAFFVKPSPSGAVTAYAKAVNNHTVYGGTLVYLGTFPY